MQIEYRKRILRDELRSEPDTLFLFGDNLEGVGYGGQAGAMRGEPNAIGIPTKRKASHTEDAYFTDNDLMEAIFYIDIAFDSIPKNAKVVIPEDGLGTGLAELPTRAPSILKYIEEKIQDLHKLENSTNCINIYRVDIELDVPWKTDILFTKYCSSLDKCRDQIYDFTKTLDIVTNIFDDSIDTNIISDIYQEKERYIIYDTGRNESAYIAQVKKLIIL